MQTDLPKLIASMEVGTARILSIVQSLQVFSRVDESSLKFFDLHEGIESSLLLLQHRFSPNVWRSKIISTSFGKRNVSEEFLKQQDGKQYLTTE